MLDLGCGTGALAIAAALERPDLRITAIDISPINVAAAAADAKAAGVDERVTVVCGNYLTMPAGKYDLIVSDSVLYLIEGSDEALASRLAADLKTEGFLVITSPIRSWTNRLRVMFRRLWRMMPATADKLVLSLARHIYPEVPADVLADRIPYLRILPVRLYGPSMIATFARHGLELSEIAALPSESLAKLTHKLIIWRRRN